MFVIGQHKDLIVNLERVNFIKIEPDENDFDIEINYADDDWDVIGTYNSFERAKEVLEEMTERIVLTQRFGAICIPERQDNMVMDMYDKEKPLFIYEMPKE